MRSGPTFGSVQDVAIEMELVGIELERPQNIPCLLLRETEGDGRVLLIFIGGPEAADSECALEQVETTRPMTQAHPTDSRDGAGRSDGRRDGTEWVGTVKVQWSGGQHKK